RRLRLRRFNCSINETPHVVACLVLLSILGWTDPFQRIVFALGRCPKKMPAQFDARVGEASSLAIGDRQSEISIAEVYRNSCDQPVYGFEGLRRLQQQSRFRRLECHLLYRRDVVEPEPRHQAPGSFVVLERIVDTQQERRPVPGSGPVVEACHLLSERHLEDIRPGQCLDDVVITDQKSKSEKPGGRPQQVEWPSLSEGGCIQANERNPKSCPEVCERPVGRRLVFG